MQHTLLKRSEQAVVAVLLIAALAAVTGYWGFRVWHKRDLVEFDEAPPLEANFRIDINRADWPELMQLPGIGHWTADIYLMEALGRPDVWPVGDLALAVGAERVKGLSGRPDQESLMALGEAWRPWRAVAARILWHYYLNTVRKGQGDKPT